MRCAIVLLLCLLSNAVVGQGFFTLKDNKVQTFSFELINNVVVVPVKINGVPLSFLLDTGVKETILFGNNQDSVDLENVYKVRFSGLGIEEGIEGLLALSNTIEVGESLIDTNHNLYVVLSDQLDLSAHLGVEINGIIGSKFFRDHLIEMDYVKKHIRIYPKEYVIPENKLKKYEEIRITLERDRPYFQTSILLNKEWVEAKLLVDMGNTDALMLFPFTFEDFEVAKPNVDDYIGKGFSGEIFGKRNRIDSYKIGKFTLRHPVVSYPDSSAVQFAKLAEGRKGSIGNQTLLRFNILIDYQKNRLLIRKNKYFGKPFYFNISGIDVKHDGLVWEKTFINMQTQRERRDPNNSFNTVITFDTDKFNYQFSLKPNYVVSGIRKNSPAEIAGVKVGDTLLKINGKHVRDLNLLEINSRLQKPSNHDMNLLLLRNGEQLRVSFRLIDPIPFKE
ncbi:PDZ domain-containing protein [Sphingobacterium hungaricum]|uniref:Aspartate aminotransferase n=1 Tax=Sphingobacterium hungaricum TaxID=2082723 RepID=A0A928UVR2_9SPHI|nr:aspartyl protease family protein [Sphingobacterium hungaricum]MBE8712190.1 aspartate aminotransferase [Sphingobacterium hungaricum]